MEGPKDEADGVLVVSGDATVVEDSQEGPLRHGSVRNGVCYVRRYYGPAKPLPGETVLEEAEEELIAVRHFPAGTVPSKLTAAFAGSVRMKEYETAKVDLMMTIPCYQEEAEDAYAWARKFVGEKVGESVARLQAMRDKANGGGKSG